jgi:hypothetical protein
VKVLLKLMPSQCAGIVDETTLTNYAGAGGTGSAPLSNFLDPLVDAADKSLPQGYLIYVFFDEDLIVQESHNGILQVNDPGVLQTLQTVQLTMPSNGYFYTYSAVLNRSVAKV